MEEVTIPVGVAAKKIHDIFQGRSQSPDVEIDKASSQFVRECQLMRTLYHPNIVQFLGVCFFQGSRLPALVVERLLTSLPDLLDAETQPPPRAPRPFSFFTLGLKCCVLHNVASGLDYLHQQTPPIIHLVRSLQNQPRNQATSLLCDFTRAVISGFNTEHEGYSSRHGDREC